MMLITDLQSVHLSCDVADSSIVLGEQLSRICFGDRGRRRSLSIAAVRNHFAKKPLRNRWTSQDTIVSTWLLAAFPGNSARPSDTSAQQYFYKASRPLASATKKDSAVRWEHKRFLYEAWVG